MHDRLNRGQYTLRLHLYRLMRKAPKLLLPLFQPFSGIFIGHALSCADFTVAVVEFGCNIQGMNNIIHRDPAGKGINHMASCCFCVHFILLSAYYEKYIGLEGSKSFPARYLSILAQIAGRKEHRTFSYASATERLFLRNLEILQ